MGIFVGIDGCRAGWLVAALKNSQKWEINIFCNVVHIWERYMDAELILIDIPIGLPQAGLQQRYCDKEARRLLGRPRSASVFNVPCRKVIHTHTYKQACHLNKQLTGKKLSKQLWNITTKIRQVDEFLLKNESARRHVKEIHPEICFWALGGGRPMRFNKREKEGCLERLKILRSIYPPTQVIVEEALRKFKRRNVAKDDILDALAAAVSALLGGDRLVSIPKISEIDARGLRMEIVYHFYQD